MTEWIKCSERLPEGSHAVLIYSKEIGITGSYLHQTAGCLPSYWVLTDDDEYIRIIQLYKITHWAELPEPPSEDS